MKEIIYQPFNVFTRGYDFGIRLDNNFARKMSCARIEKEKQARMSQIAFETERMFGFDWSTPLTFYEDTALVREFNLGNNGIWLSANSGDVDKIVDWTHRKPLVYNSHNVDRSNQACALMALFDRWIFYSESLISL